MKFVKVALVTAILMAAVPAYALEVNVGSDTHVNGNDGRAAINVSATASEQASATGTAESGSHESSSADVGGNAVVVTRASVDASGGAGVTISSPVSVSSDSDLSAYASSVVKADKNVDSASLSKSAVSLGYAQRAKFLGLFPVMINVTAEVASNGNVSLHYPWYAFLTTSDDASLRSGIEAAVAPTVSAKTATSLSASQQAQLLAEIRSAMKSSLDASLASEASASTSAQ